MNSQALVDEYLRRLERAAADLVPARRAELVEEVMEHITAALPGASARDESMVRNVLDRLGTPEGIVAMEVGPTASVGVPASPVMGPVGISTTGSWRTPARLVILALSLVLAALVAGILLIAGPGSAAFAVAIAFSSPAVLVLLLIVAVTSRKGR